MLPETPLLYTFAKAGKILGVSTRTVRRLVTRGEIGAVTFKASEKTTTIRVPRQAILDFVTPPKVDTTDASDS